MVRRLVTAMVFVCLPAALAQAQYFNIDVDQPGLNPPLGMGAPSSAFGAAAGQPGFWNTLSGVSYGPLALQDLAGNSTGVQVSVSASYSVLSDLAYNNPANTGDYALLLNDAEQVGSLSTGGTLTFTFTGIANGTYSIYTYACMSQGLTSLAEVSVPGSTTFNPQIVTGPMTGNAFALGITHSIHTIAVTGNTFQVVVNAPVVAANQGTYVNGFQIVPAPGGLAVLGLGALGGLRRRREKEGQARRA